MRRFRVIPTLLISQRRGGLVKGIAFKNHIYVGDPINAVKVFNDKGVDELVILDIDATCERRPPNFPWVEEICGEAFMPLAYGGGITCVDHVRELLQRGAEKVIINSAVAKSQILISESARLAGSQSVVAALDVKRLFLRGNRAMASCGSQDTGTDPVILARRFEQAGAGEILLTSIDREGSRSGYDLSLIRSVADAVKIPVIANGGAGSLTHFEAAIQDGKASAVAAGTMFVFVGGRQGILISYPSPSELEALFRKLS